MALCDDANADRRSSAHGVLGRLLLAIRGSELGEGHLDYWRAMNGGIVLEWIEGPNASEARTQLMHTLVDTGSTVLRADDLALTPDRLADSTDNVVHLRIDDVPVEFRALAPVGWPAFTNNNRAARHRVIRGGEDIA